MSSANYENLHRHTPCYSGKFNYFLRYSDNRKNIINQILHQECCEICGKAITPPKGLRIYFCIAEFVAPILITVLPMLFILLFNIPLLVLFALPFWHFSMYYLLLYAFPALVCTFGRWNPADTQTHGVKRRHLIVQLCCWLGLGGLVSILCLVAIFSKVDALR